jgi:glutamate 5-kinase
VTSDEEKGVRAVLATARRIVVKIGSRSLAARPELPRLLATQITQLRAGGRTVVLVSSGAVALGMERLGFKVRPTDVAQLQAAASAGQSELMRRYDEAFRWWALDEGFGQSYAGS